MFHNKNNYIILITSIIALLSANQVFSWGFYGHKKINQMAVFALPPEMIGFYKSNIEYLAAHAVDPDKRRNVVEAEGCRHYIDLDHYGQHPFDSIPKYWKDAVEKFTEDSLEAYGIVPWHIEKMVYRLTEAFKEENKEKILKLSAELGHYAGDACVPLHTTENYNGQLTGQKGIHGLWESRVPELLGEKYNYYVGKALYIDKPIDEAWKTVKMSFSEKDSVLLFEKNLSQSFPPDKKYGFDTGKKQNKKIYSQEYALEYNRMLNNMAERKMQESIKLVCSLWYTAWVNAGQPDLNKLSVKGSENKEKDTEEPTQKNKPAVVKGHEE